MATGQEIPTERGLLKQGAGVTHLIDSTEMELCFFSNKNWIFFQQGEGGLDNISSRTSTPDSSSWHLVCSLMRPTWTTSHAVLDPWAPKCQGERNRCGFKLIKLRWCVRQQSKANTWESRIFLESADHCWSLSSKWVKSLGNRGGMRVPLFPSQLYTGCTHMMLVSSPRYTMRG